MIEPPFLFPAVLLILLILACVEMSVLQIDFINFNYNAHFYFYGRFLFYEKKKKNALQICVDFYLLIFCMNCLFFFSYENARGLSMSGQHRAP